MSKIDLDRVDIILGDFKTCCFCGNSKNIQDFVFFLEHEMCSSCKDFQLEKNNNFIKERRLNRRILNRKKKNKANLSTNDLIEDLSFISTRGTLGKMIFPTDYILEQAKKSGQKGYSF